MTVSAISSTAPPLGPQGADASSWIDRMRQAMTPVAQLFGESSQQLMSDLQSGQTSLASLAQSKGISQTDLLDAIKQGLTQMSPNGGPQRSDSQLSNLASTIANRLHHGHHHHGGGAGGAAPVTDPNASAALSALNALSSTAAGNDSDGDSDGSTAASAAVSSGYPSPAGLDVQRLLFDLRTMQPGATSVPSATASANVINLYENAPTAAPAAAVPAYSQAL